jgi:predicted dehydrogenase/threonine dehydrogenase-like Zn-dependent dehydrogenase
MKQVITSSKSIDVIDVPSSLIEKGTVLVEVDYSFISTGTELMALRSLGLNQTENNGGAISRRISESKELIRKVVNYLHDKGIRKTVERVFVRLSDDDVTIDRLITLGYSCSGRVVSVGEGVSAFSPGDLVACAGANRATHSELVVVPVNLVVPIPKGCSLKNASSVAVGSIAMQGVRQSDTRIGEFVGVIGLGLIGLLTVRLLKIAGCQVFGLDRDEKRVSQAIEIGADFASSNPEVFCNHLHNQTRFEGLDCCIITASSDSDEIVQTAIDSTRQRGRVVALGFVPMKIQKYPFMRKEIEFVSSSSYGPGRYDQRYEDHGFDYPYAFVRWTEKRNMAEYLRLLASEEIDLSMVANEEVLLSSVNEGYDQLIKGQTKSRGIFINYASIRTLEEKSEKVIQLASSPISGKVRLAVVGAGSFVKAVHLPNLVKLEDQIEICVIVNKGGAHSIELARHYGVDHASTSLNDVLDSVDFDAVLIGTRHDKHTEMALKCLESRKHVFVEKPLAINWDQLNKIKEFYDTSPERRFPILMTGFNRRFSPYLGKIKKHVNNRSKPLVMNYQINTKHLGKNHWQRGDEGGGRNLGEACHIYDLFTFLCDAEVDHVSASSIRSVDGSIGRNENFAVIIKFADGSIGNLTYTSLGSIKYPKEICHIYCDQSVFYLNNYTSLNVFGPTDDILKTESPNKGHFEEIEMFVRAIKGEIDWPIPFWQQVQATEIALNVEDLINDLRSDTHV